MDIKELSDIQSESGIIGTLIYHPEYIAHSDYLKPNYFFEKDNACLYWAIQELFRKGITNIDAYNIVNQLQSNKGVWKTLEKFNLPNLQEFIQLYKKVARNSLAEYKMLVDNVVSLSFKRDLVKTTNEIDIDCFDGKKSLEELSTSTYSKLEDLTKKDIVTSEVATIGEQIDSIWDDIVSRRSEDGIYGLPSKFECFMPYFTYEPGELVVIQAKMKMGKSFFMMNEAVHKLKNGVPTLVIDTEMPTRLWTESLLSHLSGVDISKVKSGLCSDEENYKIASAKEWLKGQPLVHIYETNPNMDKVYSTCRMLQNKMNLGFVVYDYLKSNQVDSSANYNILGAHCDYLKNKVAGELNIPVLAACQSNRQGEVADSMKILRYASVVVDWGYKDQEEINKDGIQCGNAKAKIIVNRLGRQMDITNENEYLDFVFDGSIGTISQATQHDTSGADDIF